MKPTKKQKSEDLTQAKGDVDFLPSYSISSFMLFQKNNQLKTETGRLGVDEPQTIQTNPNSLHNISSELNNRKLNKEHGKRTRLIRFIVSPSSTVSSLSMCIDLDTPQNHVKSPNVKSLLSPPTPLEESDDSSQPNFSEMEKYNT